MLRLLIIISLLCAAATTASAGIGPSQSTIGTKGPISLPAEGDALSMYRMPSGAGWSLESRVDLTAFLFYGEGSSRNSLNNADNSGSTLGASFGVMFAPGRPDFDTDDNSVWDEYSDANKFTIGVGVYVAMAGGGEKSDVRFTTFPNTIGITSGIQFLDNTWTLAYTPHEKISLGLGIHIIRGTLKLRTLVGGDSTPLNGSPTINGVPIPGNPSYSDFLDIFSNDVDEDPTTYFKGDLSGFQFAATLAVSFKPLENLAIGFSYRFRSIGPAYEGEGTILADRTFELALQGLSPAIQQLFLDTLPNRGTNGFSSDYDVELEGIYVPRQIRANVAFWPTERWLIAGEVAWIEWHRAFDEAELSLEDGNNIDVSFVTGSTSLNSTSSARWRNQWAFSLQTAFGVNKYLTLRGGFQYLSENNFNSNYESGSPPSGYSRFNLSGGVGVRPVPSLELSFMVEHSFHTSERSDNSVSAPTARNTYYSSKQWFFNFGASVSF